MTGSGAPGRLEIAVAGGAPALRIDDGPPIVPHSRRAAALLAFLAFSPGHVATRDRLADLLWSQRGPDQARASLRQCLLELRGLSDQPWLAADRTRVWLSAERISVDVLATITRVADCVDAAAARSIRTNRLLAELNAGSEVDQWVLETRATIERDLLRAIAARCDALSARGDHHGARLLAEAGLDICPDNEDITIKAMTADIRLGETAAALKRYEALRRVLERDLGCAPGAAVTRLRDEVIAGRATPARATPGDDAASLRAPSAALDRPPLLLVPAFGVPPGGGAEMHATAIREEILAGLARFRDIRVSSRATPVAVDDMSAGEADRAYALVITLHGEGGDARLVARVTRLGGDEIIWVETIDLGRLGSAGGVALVVKRVIAAVLPAVTENLFRQLDGRANGPYDAYLVARHRSIHSLRHEDVAAAGAELERIVRERPDFAPAYAPLARLLNTDYFYSALGTSGSAERRRALDLALMAVTLDPQDAHNHAVLGFCHLWHGQPSLARKRFDRVLELNPYNVVRLFEVATGLVYLGEFAESRQILTRTAALGIGHNDAYHEDMGRLHLAEGDHAAALGELELVTHHNIQTQLYAALAASVTGRTDAAESISAWREQVVARWRGDAVPDDAAIAAWVATHHPFGPGLKEAFMADVVRMLRAAPAA